MADHRFKSYLQSRPQSDATRAFIDDAMGDANLPDAKSWDELLTYLEERGAKAEVLSIAQYVWGQYVNA